MALKILADTLFPERVVEEMRRAGYDAVHAVEIGAGDLPLMEILSLAVFENRILVTGNRAVARLVESGVDARPSVVFFKQLKGGSAAISHVLLNLLSLFNEDLAEGAVVIVREGQTLLRKLTRPGAPRE
jgi:predicted nuclease of predicted toxin-antitoxin system